MQFALCIFVLVQALGLPVTISGQECALPSLAPSYAAPVVAEGWAYRLIGNDFERPRTIVFDTRGALLVLDAGVGVKHVTMTDGGGTCLSVAQTKELISMSDLNHGLALSADGKTLFASTAASVYAWRYNAENGTVEPERRTVVDNMQNSGHTTRTLFLSERHPGKLLVSRGSGSNVDPDASDRSTGHCQLRMFDVGDGIDAGPGAETADFVTQGTLLGWGLRNSVGVTVHPTTGGIWSVENSVDQLQRLGSDIHRDNPGEELNYHGSINDSTKDQGGNHGYPRCYALWSTNEFPELGEMSTGDQFTVSQTEALNDSSCAADFVPPRLTFQAHTAPLDIKFSPDGDAAFVTFHGSWNRDDPAGYRLATIAFADGFPVDAANSTTAARDILSNANLRDCPSGCFRPVGLAFDKSNRLFMTSDSTGELYVLENSKLTPTTSPEPPPAPSVPAPNGARRQEVSALCLLCIAAAILL